MQFESLAYQHEFEIADFPAEWVPLTHLYDPDLPLFPLMYFHRLDPDAGSRPLHRDRIYGYIKHLSYRQDKCTVTIVTNKDLSQSSNSRFVGVVMEEVRGRLGVQSPVTRAQIAGAMSGSASTVNPMLVELWHQVVGGSFGGRLPYGNLWDGVFGLARFIASWNSQGGRKGELIQTHAYSSEFGERISVSDGVFVDFYLLPTFEELTDGSNPLSIFPRFEGLLRAVSEFFKRFCGVRSTSSGSSYAEFSMVKAGLTGVLDTAKLLRIFDSLPSADRDVLYQLYSAFNRGPPRAILAILMHRDLRVNGWDPRSLTPRQCAEQYRELARTYQSPKVMQLYAQQCFGSDCALPVDNWVDTFTKWPLAVSTGKAYDLFQLSDIWGRVERLIWMCSQARKVHSSVAREILWCIRYGTPDKAMRGANPLSCKICLPHIRAVCPAYLSISTGQVSFNGGSGDFVVATSSGNNSPGQRILSCTGAEIQDQYSVADRPGQFSTYPSPANPSARMKVSDFLATY